MPVDNTNVLTSGQTSFGASRNPLHACLPASSGAAFLGFMALGAIVGTYDVQSDETLKTVAMWKPNQVFTTSAAPTPVSLQAPTAVRGVCLRVTSPSDASDVLGNTQIQASDGTVNTALARFVLRPNHVTHFHATAKWSDPAGATLVGLCNVATGLMAANGTVAGALTDGVYFYRAPGSSTVTVFVRVGGVNVASAPATTIAAAGFNNELAFQATTKGVTWSYRDGQTGATASGGIDLSALSAPAANLGFTAIQGGNARTLDLLRMFAAQEAI